MERVFFVENGDLSEVNKWLRKGAFVKSLNTVAEGGGEGCTGAVYAYVVLESTTPSIDDEWKKK